jgi:hypothetical protein
MTLLPFIMVPVKCPNLRNCAVFDIVKKSEGTTEIRLLKILLPFPFTVCHSDSLHRSGTHAPASRIDDRGYLPLFATTIDGVVNLVRNFYEAKKTLKKGRINRKN